MPLHLTKIPSEAALPTATGREDGYPTVVGRDVYVVDTGVFIPTGVPTADALTATATLPNVERQFVKVDATAGNVVVTLPAVSVGRRVTLKRIDAAVNTVTVQGASGNVDGAASSAALAAQYDVLDLVSDGTDWWIV